jgi:hypothetical protein
MSKHHSQKVHISCYIYKHELAAMDKAREKFRASTGLELSRSDWMRGKICGDQQWQLHPELMIPLEMPVADEICEGLEAIGIREKA